ncbi:MAG: carbon-nitrogen hydrolase [Gemmatimonadetes bacterium]|nr:carbon-nitrogen hydrolase [Gemmatimonadota bacterium]
MRRPVRLRVVQSAPLLGDVDANLAAHAETIAEAADDGRQLVVFPELSLTGYALGDLVDAVALDPSHPRWPDLLALSAKIDVVVGFVERGGDGWLHNAAAYLSGGRLLHLHRKTYLPTYGMFDEGRFFVPGDTLETFEAPWGRGALVICEEAWHPSVVHAAVGAGAHLLIVTANAPGRRPIDGGWESQRAWRAILSAYARLYAVGVVFASRVGWEEGLLFGGASAVWGFAGRTIAQAREIEPETLDAVLEPDDFRRARIANPAHGVERDDLLIEALERAGGRSP